MTHQTRFNYDGEPCPHDDSLNVARGYVFADVRFRSAATKHNPCPCCRQNVKLRKRSLNFGSVSSLCWLVAYWLRHHHEIEWINIPAVAPKFVINSREHGRLESCWGLLESRPNGDDPSRKCSGDWRPTDRGISFALNKIRISPCRLTYDHANYGDAFGDPATAKEIINKKDGYDYAEMMGSDAFGSDKPPGE